MTYHHDIYIHVIRYVYMSWRYVIEVFHYKSVMVICHWLYVIQICHGRP